MGHRVAVLDVTEFAPEAFRIVIERPEGYVVRRGEAADVALGEEGLSAFARPFHFRGVDDPDRLEFTVFAYADADPLLHRFVTLQPGDLVSISDAYRPDVRDAFLGGWRRPTVRAPAKRTTDLN